MDFDDPPPEIGEFEPLAHNVQDIGSFAFDLQNNASRIVGQLACAHCRIPADDRLIADIPQRQGVIDREPRPFDEIAARSDRFLLKLGSKIDRTH